MPPSPLKPETPSPYNWLENALQTLHRAHWYRSPQTITSAAGPIVSLAGQELINFASNDYLGLTHDPRLIQAAIAATETYGTGATGSRLLSGQRPLHRELEGAIAALKQTEDALVFSSGYLANLGTIAALVGKRDLILGDRYNHSSLKKGAILSGATVLDYAHGDMDELAQQLQRQRGQYQRCLIATDGVFSMDGDLCPLPQLLDLAQRHSAMLLVDEAHGTGVLGDRGAGVVEHLGCTGQPLIQMGTLSKALGSLGGYVAGSAPLIDFLRNRAPSWIYTTGLSPADTAAALAALQIVQQEPERRARLWRNTTQLQDILNRHFSLLPSQSPICCIQLPSPVAALALAQQLQAEGIFAPAIRPPTVPTSRIRFSVMATHTAAQLQQLESILRRSVTNARPDYVC
ncbi:MAG: 8-amino-7-oxononanoate synthase [Cyanobacteria bacterium P01_G01_bin.54]